VKTPRSPRSLLLGAVAAALGLVAVFVLIPANLLPDEYGEPAVPAVEVALAGIHAAALVLGGLALFVPARRPWALLIAAASTLLVSELSAIVPWVRRHPSLDSLDGIQASLSEWGRVLSSLALPFVGAAALGRGPAGLARAAGGALALSGVLGLVGQAMLHVSLVLVHGMTRPWKGLLGFVQVLTTLSLLAMIWTGVEAIRLGFESKAPGRRSRRVVSGIATLAALDALYLLALASYLRNLWGQISRPERSWVLFWQGAADWVAIAALALALAALLRRPSPLSLPRRAGYDPQSCTPGPAASPAAPSPPCSSYSESSPSPS
jgi:hypothetical protein